MDDVNVNIERFVKNKIYKKQRKLVLAVILILLGVIAFIYQYMTYKRIVDNPVSIEEMADKNGGGNSCYYIYMTLDRVLNEFTKNGDQSVCFAYVGDECYIVEADPPILNRLNARLEVGENVEVRGLALPIMDYVKDPAIQALENSNMDITDEEFDDMFGRYVIWLEIDKVTIFINIAAWLFIFILATIPTGILLGLYQIDMGIVFYKDIKKKGISYYEFYNEISGIDVVLLPHSSTILTRKHIYYIGPFIKVYEPEKILWIYDIEQYDHGVKANDAIVVKLDNGRSEVISEVPSGFKKDDAVAEEYRIFTDYMQEKNPEVLMGNTLENGEFYNKRVKSNVIKKKHGE